MRSLLASKTLTATASVLAMTLALSSPGFAQVVDEPDPSATLEGEVEIESGQDRDEAEAEGGGAIVVTGSRIRRPNLESNQPITSVGIQELTDTGDVSIGDALNDLPSLRSTFGQGNSTRFIGTSGLNVLDLRGLGTARTLVLVNGRRHVTALPGENWVDVNMIPTDLIERVDVVTGGNSAIYGSDAVAGVVNFVLRRDFEGIRVRGQSGISEEGDRGSYFVSAIAGQNFGDGRGNVAVNLEYAKQQEVKFTDRDALTGAYSGRCQFQATDQTIGEPSTGDGIPDNQFLCGVRNGSISDIGTIGGLGGGAYLRFRPDGTLYVDQSTASFPGISGNVIGGQGSTLRNTGQLAPELSRYSANLLARFEIAPALVPFVEATYVHVDANQEGQPSFFVGSIPAFFGGGSNLRCNNPFLRAQALATLQSYGLCTNVAAGTFSMARFNVDFGGRGEDHARDTYRVVGGIEGEFNGDWRYEVSANYGRFESQMNSINNLLLFDINGNETGFLTAIDAVRDPATGQIVCRSAAARAEGCVPINVFGDANLTQAQSDYIHEDAQRTEWADQLVFNAFVSGNSSRFFNLPGGAVGFALGAEYRKEDSFSEWDPLTRSGGTFMNAIATFDPPALEVKEAFGELRLPILRNLPFAEELTVELAGRVSDYNNNVGTVYAYNVGATWAPVPDLRFRGNYSTSVRAPTQGDLYSPQSENFAFIADPCSAENIANNPNRAANCAAAGVPLVATPGLVAACADTAFPVAPGAAFNNCLARTFSTGFTSGGNPDLTEEKGKSWTLGAVFTPRFIPGLSLTVDYYNIEVEQLIATLTAQTIINSCYDDPNGIDNPYCETIQRDAATGLFVEPAVLSSGVNFASQETEGIDVELAYRRTFANGDGLSFRTVLTHVFDINNYTSPQFPDSPNRQLGELGDPIWAFNTNINYDFGAVDISYGLRYLGKMSIGAWETQHPYTGTCTAASVASIGCTLGELTTLPPTNPDFTQEVYYPAAFYHNIRMGYEVNDRFSFYGGIDNLTDKKPPLGLLGTAGGDPYDSFGRFFYVGAKVGF